METQCQHLTMTQRNELLQLLQKFKELFDGTLVTWKIYSVDFELKENTKPICSRLYTVQKVHEDFFKEVERLVLLGVLEVANDSEWGASSFAQTKHKLNLVRFLSESRNQDKKLKRKPYPIPKINEMLLKLEGFQYAASLDLNMGYYHIRLSEKSINLCTIILTWVKYQYKRLPMGVVNSPEIFQNKMNDLFHGF